MLDVFGRKRPEVVYHLAAQIDVRHSVADPAADARINVEGTTNVLNASLEAGVKRFVNTSTGGAIYGEGQILPAPENHPVAPMSPYGNSKFCAENYCSLFRRLHGLPTVSLRYGNVYGPRQDPLGEAGVIAIFCGKLIEGGRPMVFGDGRQTRDYDWVGDVVSANLAAVTTDTAGPYNVGTGRETSVLELVDVLREVSGDDSFEPEFAPERPGEVQRIAIDPSRAREELGWEAKMDLRDGLAKLSDQLANRTELLRNTIDASQADAIGAIDELSVKMRQREQKAQETFDRTLGNISRRVTVSGQGVEHFAKEGKRHH